MPKSIRDKLARKAQYTKGCIEIMISENSLEPELWLLSSKVYETIKRDTFFRDKSPQVSAFYLLWTIMELYYDSVPVQRGELVKPMVEFSLFDTGDIDKAGTASEIKEFQAWVEKVFKTKAKMWL